MTKMKKIVSILIALMMFVLMATPAMADDFVKSIGYKDHPELEESTNEDGEKYVGIIRDKDGNILDYVPADCIVITPVSQVESSKEIPDASRAMLKKVYAALTDGSMKLPYEKYNLDPSKMVIRDLFDVSFLCTEHPEMLIPQGVTLELTFKLGVKKNVKVCTMTYKNDQWGAIVSVKNNGNGTVTCVFEDFCPVAFSVPISSIGGGGTGTGDNANLGLWSALLAGSAIAIGAMVVVSRRKKTA